MGKRVQTEPGKMVAVLVLSLVAAVMAYFRFVRKPGSSAPPAGPVPAEAFFPIPKLPDSVNGLATPGIPRGAYSAPRRDIFAPPVPLPLSPESPGESASAQAGKAVSPPAPARPRLTGIMQSAQGLQAIIDGTIIRAGDRVGAYTVAAIGLRQVVLTSATERIVLPLGH